jgi:hypothetical protein
MSVPNYANIVAEMRTAYPEAWHHAHRGGPRTEEFIRLLAARLHSIDARVGLNGKRGNENDISDDALCVKEPGQSIDTRTGARVQVIDVIAGAPNSYSGPDGAPSWGEVWNPEETPTRATWVQPAAWAEPVEPKPEPKPEPQPQPVDLSAVVAALAAIGHELAAQRERLDAIPAAIVAEREKVEAVVKDVAAKVDAIAWPTYRARIFGQSVTLTPEGK